MEIKGPGLALAEVWRLDQERLGLNPNCWSCLVPG